MLVPPATPPPPPPPPPSPPRPRRPTPTRLPRPVAAITPTPRLGPVPCQAPRFARPPRAPAPSTPVRSSPPLAPIHGRVTAGAGMPACPHPLPCPPPVPPRLASISALQHLIEVKVAPPSRQYGEVCRDHRRTQPPPSWRGHPPHPRPPPPPPPRCMHYPHAPAPQPDASGWTRVRWSGLVCNTSLLVPCLPPQTPPPFLVPYMARSRCQQLCSHASHLTLSMASATPQSAPSPPPPPPPLPSGYCTTFVPAASAPVPQTHPTCKLRPKPPHPEQRLPAKISSRVSHINPTLVSPARPLYHPAPPRCALPR